MTKFIAAAALLAAQWQPANAQTILGSIPEEFRGDWCWQENTNDEQIFKSGICKLKTGSLSIDRMTLDDERRHPQHEAALLRSQGRATVDVRCPGQATP